MEAAQSRNKIPQTQWPALYRPGFEAGIERQCGSRGRGSRGRAVRKAQRWAPAQGQPSGYDAAEGVRESFRRGRSSCMPSALAVPGGHAIAPGSPEYVRGGCSAEYRKMPASRPTRDSATARASGPGGSEPERPAAAEGPRIDAATGAARIEAGRLLAHRRGVQRSTRCGAERGPRVIDGVEDRHFLPRRRRMSTGCEGAGDAQDGKSGERTCEFPAVHGGLLLQDRDIELTAKVRLASKHRQTINRHGTGDGLSATRRFVRLDRCDKPPRRCVKPSHFLSGAAAAPRRPFPATSLLP